MTARMRAGLVLVGLLVLGSAAVEAQRGPAMFGPRVMYHFDGSDFGIGAHLTAPVADAISFYPSFEYWFVGNGVTALGLNADIKYHVPGESVEWLYVGGGLGISRFSADCGSVDCSSTNVGLNVIGGFQPVGSGRIKPFAEGRLWLGDGSGFSVAAGLLIPLGR